MIRRAQVEFREHQSPRVQKPAREIEEQVKQQHGQGDVPQRPPTSTAIRAHGGCARILAIGRKRPGGCILFHESRQYFWYRNDTFSTLLKTNRAIIATARKP